MGVLFVPGKTVGPHDVTVGLVRGAVGLHGHPVGHERVDQVHQQALAGLGVLAGLDPDLARLPEADVLIPVVVVAGVVLDAPVQSALGVAVVVHDHAHAELCRAHGVDLGGAGGLDVHAGDAPCRADGPGRRAEHGRVPAQVV